MTLLFLRSPPANSRLHHTGNPPRHGPDRKGKKGFQGKETVGCVPLGQRRSRPVQKPSTTLRESCGAELAQRQFGTSWAGSKPPDLYSACSLQGVAEVLWHGMGDDVVFWRRVLELAGWLVVRQQFLPGVLETWEDPSRWLPFWYVMWEAEDLERLALLAAAMPMAARAVNQRAREPPLDEPRLQVRDVVMRLVDHLVWMGHIYDSVWEHYPRPRRRKTVMWAS